MSQALPVTGVVPLAQMTGEDDIETAMLVAMAEKAQAFLTDCEWCAGVQELYFGKGVGNVVAVFLAHLKPGRPEVDEYLWMVVGDLPTMYFVTEDCPTSADVIDGYLDTMRRWVAVGKLGQPSEEVFQVRLPPTPEWAAMLEPRLDFIEQKILPTWRAQND